MSRLTAYQYDSADGGDMRRVLRSVTEIDGLLLLLTLLYLLVARESIARPWLYMMAIAVYGAVVLALRHTQNLESFGRERLVAASATMVIFITAVLAAAGADDGPLLNLYLLPVLTAALTMARGTALAVIALALAGRVCLSAFVRGHDVATLAYGLTLLTEVSPVLLVAMLTATLAADIGAARERLQLKSDQDPVTGLLNLQAFTRLLEEERVRAGRRGANFALLLVDIDGLKMLNERLGTDAGHRALVAVGQAIQRSSRSADLVARYGGDEFIVFLAGADAAAARMVGNRIRHHVATTTLEIDGSLHRVTVSIGAAVFPADGRDLRDLIRVADRAVGKEKARGRGESAPQGDPDPVPHPYRPLEY